MHRTTIYLPDELKSRLASVAQEEHRSEADIIREALDTALRARIRPRPRIPLLAGATLGRPDAAERSDELLEGFGS